MIPRDTIEKIRASNGTDTVPGNRTAVTEDEQGNEVVEKGDVPYGYTLVGSLQQLERIAEEMDEYGLTPHRPLHREAARVRGGARGASVARRPPLERTRRERRW